MKKIPTIWQRDPSNPRLVHQGQWTEGITDALLADAVATVKYDGTCVMLDDDGRWWARRTVKKDKPEPSDWVYVDTDGDKRQGWEPIEQSGYHKIFAAVQDKPTSPGTYELVGPRIGTNPYGLLRQELRRHGANEVGHLTAAEAVTRLTDNQFEGIVWWRDGEPFAKLKRSDLGLFW